MNKKISHDGEIPEILYDKDGNPIDTSNLRVHKHNTTEQPPQHPHQMVYVARPHEPIKQHISDEVKQKHADSKRQFPHLNLSEGEYIISAIRRHPIGLFQIWSVVAIAIFLLIFLIIWVMTAQTSESAFLSAESTPWLALILLTLVIFMFIGGLIATIVYEGNRFFLTNESVTQHIQLALFSKKEQTISLGNIEDASFRQHGVLQSLLNYGSIRLSTEGDETTYRFNYVSNPSKQIALLNDAVEAFKMGRPVNENDN